MKKKERRKTMKVIYVISPYRSKTINGVHENIEVARKAAVKLWRMGFVVLCPHLNSAFMDGVVSDDQFLEAGLELLKRCDGVYLTEVACSEGCRQEEVTARINNIETFTEGDEKALSAWQVKQTN